MTTSTSTTLILTTLLTTFTLLNPTSSQSTNTPPCVSNLIPCANYLATTTTPPQSCCTPLKVAVTTQIDCLCGLYNTPGLLQSFGVNITQALDLPKRCRIDGASLDACSKVAGVAPSPSEMMAPAPTGISGTPGKDGNAAVRMNGLGASKLMFMVPCIGVLLW